MIRLTKIVDNFDFSYIFDLAKSTQVSSGGQQMAVNTKRELCGETVDYKMEAKNKKSNILGGKVEN